MIAGLLALSIYLCKDFYGVVALVGFLSERESLIEKVDKKELLQECRKLIVNRDLFEMSDTENLRIIRNEKSTVIFLTYHDGMNVFKNIPAIITKLQPGTIIINKDRIVLVLFSGHVGLSIIAFDVDIVGEGDEKLIDGLWINRR